MLHGDGEKSQSHSMAAHGMRDEQVVWCGVVWCGVVLDQGLGCGLEVGYLPTAG